MSLFLRPSAKSYRSSVCVLFAVCFSLAGCSLFNSKAPDGSQESRLGSGLGILGVEVTQRALPTSGGGAVTNAHYDHVYVDPAWSGSKYLQTITLDDAVQNNVLIDNDLAAKSLVLTKAGESLRWVVFEAGFERPSTKEAVGGAGIEDGLHAEVNFDLNEVEMINPEKLTALVERGRLISGSYFVVGYTDPTGTERGNMKLAQLRALAVAESLMDAGVHKSRIQHKGVGISKNYPTNEQNRRAAIAFVADE